ncbi:MAG: hypothetical protein KDB01_17590, partial [Planctomycetaceae bacterium]|nr:hypothetical protein [Planctomycetaceae bacterium]
MNLRLTTLPPEIWVLASTGYRTLAGNAHILLVLFLLLKSALVADERFPRFGAGSESADEFPEFRLEPLLPGGSSSDIPLPPLDDPDSSAVPRRSRDYLPPVLSDRNPTGADPGDYLPPVRSDRSPLRNDPGRRISEPRNPFPARNFDDLRDPGLPAEDGSVVAEGFDWRLQPVTLADLEVGHPWSFEHTKPNLSEAEMEDYVRLIRAAKDRKSSIGLNLPDDVNITSAWESAFYRFAEARRQAWNNGTLLLQPPRSGLADPFASSLLSTADRIESPVNLKSYSLTADMQSHPSDFVGRPVVLYGLFTPSVINQLRARKTTGSEKSVYQLQRGFLRNLSNTKDIALVDAEGFVDYDSQKRAIEAWPV